MANTNYMKRITWLVLLVIGGFLFCGFSMPQKEISIKIQARGEVVLEGDFTLNPRIGENEVAVLRGCVDTYGEIGVLDYMLGDLGSRLNLVYEKLDDVKVSDCINFVPKSREKFFYDTEVGSLWVKRGEVVKKILDSFGDGKIEIELDFCKGDIRYRDEELRAYTAKVSSFCTVYANSINGRKQNISRAVGFITGKVLESGESFSFNQVVGKRTKDRGFQEAKIIVDGKYVEGVGGGVCQVATTLYNSAIRADMRVDRCVRHTLAPSYVDLSFDAMVSEWCDLVFTNTTPYPVFIEATADGERLAVTFYGKARDYDLRFESVVKEVVRHQLFDGTNGEQYRNGYKSEGYKIVLKGGKVVERVKIRQDYYKPYETKKKITEKEETTN